MNKKKNQEVVDTNVRVSGEEGPSEKTKSSTMRRDLSQLHEVGNDDLGLELELALSSQYRS